jgi:ribokinase
MSILIFGSINMDLVVRAPRFPNPGETITGSDFFHAPGGKGANQAVACARLGAEAQMIGRVGADVFSEALLENLQREGVGTSQVSVDRQHPSGVALITLDDRSENSIIVVPGANGALDEGDLARLGGALPSADLLLLQLEVPLQTVISAARSAHQRGVRVILDPAPAQPLPPELYQWVDILTPNESEAATLVGFQVDDTADARRAAAVLLERGAREAIIKMGRRGALWKTPQEEQHFPSFHVQAVDTVAAGDAFNGALAVALAEGQPPREAVRWAMAAGALATTIEGAQPSMPDRRALEEMLSG